jgi:hypothetical protein
VRYLPVAHATEAYFPTLAGVIAALLVALAFGWKRPRRPLGWFGVAYMFSLFIFVPAAFWVVFDGMTKAPLFPEEFAYYFTAGVVWMLLFALEVALIKRAENLDDDSG